MRVDDQRFGVGCVKGCLVYAALCVLGALSMMVFGDRIDTRAMTFENRTRRALFAAFDEPNGVGERRLLRAKRSVRLLPFEGQLLRSGGIRIALFGSKDAPKPFTALRLSERALDALDQGKARILIDEGRVLRARVAYDK